MSSRSQMRFVPKDDNGFRVNQEGQSSFVYGRFLADGRVVVSVYIDKEMVFSETIAPPRRKTHRSTRGTADFFWGQP